MYQKLKYAPTLNTILMVEETLKNMEDSVMTVAELKRKLPRKVNHRTLMAILDYLDKSNKIVFSVKGITWIVNDSLKLKKAIAEGTKFEDLSKSL